MRYVLILGVLFAATTANAQWEIQPAPTTSDLRGIDNVGKGIAWASGSDGTVLRTIDDGKDWQLCPIPPGAEKLDFRGIQAFDEKTAIVMSTGKGPLSRLYKTSDACQSWTLLFTNPDPDGSWDDVVVQFSGSPAYPNSGTVAIVLGDPIDSRFTLFHLFSNQSKDDPKSIISQHYPAVGTSCRERLRKPYYDPRDLQMPPAECDYNNELILPSTIPAPLPGETLFAASNSTLCTTTSNDFSFVTGGPAGAHYFLYHYILSGIDFLVPEWISSELPLAKGSTAGAFSLSRKDGSGQVLNVVGGDYLKPNVSVSTAAFTNDGGKSWLPAVTPPHGFRSAVAYDAARKTWITVGPNGTDISTDDGRNWRALRPNPALHEPTDADRDWNALSLPFVVGPHGRIGKLRPEALK
jgi:hypothetical protein